MLPMNPAARAVLLQFNTVLSIASILDRRVITLFALITRKRDDLPRIASLGHRHTFLTSSVRAHGCASLRPTRLP